MKQSCIWNTTLIVTLLFTVFDTELLSKDLSIKVIDYDSKEPIEKVAIRLNQSKIVGFTDKFGFALVNTNSKDSILEFYKAGYQLEKKWINTTIDSLQIKLISISKTTNTILISSDKLESKLSQYNEHEHLLQGEELVSEMGQTIAASLKNMAGIAVRSMGPAPARPVIRSLSGNRVSINEDGLPIIDMSATSPDHAVATDPLLVQRINIQRGARVLINTQNALGGMINIIKNSIPRLIENTAFSFAYGFESANRGNSLGLDLELPIDKLVLKGMGTIKNTNDLYTPEGFVNNSKFRNVSTNLMSKYFFDEIDLAIDYNYLNTNYGIPGGFVGAHPKGVIVNMDKNNINLKSSYHPHGEIIDDVRFSLSRSYYFHTEFESNDKIGAQFNIVNYNSQIEFIQHEGDIFSNGSFGANFTSHFLDYGGFVFVPATRSYDLSFFIFEEIKSDDFEFQFSVRPNYYSVIPEKEATLNIGKVQNKEFALLSWVSSALYSLNEEVLLGLNLARTMRAPTTQELFSEGPHLAAYSFEVGNPNLESEKGYGLELFSNYKIDDFSLSISTYYYDYSNFIVPRNTGSINVQTLLPIFASNSVSASLYGIEVSSNFSISKNLRMESNLTLSEGRNNTDNKWLPLIPPYKLNLELNYIVDELTIFFKSELAASQTKLDQFEQFTASYSIFNFGANYKLDFDNSFALFSLTIDNLTNQIYRNHLSRIKSILPEAGRNLRFNMRMYF
jgi:iron complex outermembrane receptor protein